MDWKREWKWLLGIVAGFLICYYLPVGWSRFDQAVFESLALVKWYAREHVLLCLVPAFFIAGAVGVFVSQASVMKYLGAGANKVIAYGVAAVSGTILAVCSCTILPLFAGIYRMGAGLGPACTFLYSGPAINVLAIILTARILGLELGIARAVGAIVFSVLIGLCMHVLFRHEEKAKAQEQAGLTPAQDGRPLWQTALYFAAMVGILVFANWGAPQQEVRLVHVDRVGDGHHLGSGVLVASDSERMVVRVDEPGFLPAQSGEIVTIQRSEYEADGGRIEVSELPGGGAWAVLHAWKWRIASGFALLLAVCLVAWFGVAWWRMAVVALGVGVLAWAFPARPVVPFAAGVLGLSLLTSTGKSESRAWFSSSWSFAKQILPLLFFGVLIAGFLLGRPDQEGMIPSGWVQAAVGGNSLTANLFASVAGAFMYFATLTEVPILQGLIGAGMGKGPALALLLAGPALSLPNMLVIRSVLGTKKTVAFVLLVIVMATASGLLFGAIGPIL